MKKKLISVILSVCIALCVGGCVPPIIHTHTYDLNQWTKDSVYHWHASTCGHEQYVSDKAKHIFDDSGICSVCGYVSSAKGLHDHTYSDKWSMDSYSHWHAATCEHTALTVDRAQHTLGNNTCTVCGFVADTENKLILALDEDGSFYRVIGVTGEDKVISVPISYKGKPISEIADNAFANLNIWEVRLTGNIKKIGENAFLNNRNLTHINFGNSVEVIGKGAFEGCEALRIVDLKTATSVGDRAFYGCRDLERVYLNKYVYYIGSEAFGNCPNLVLNEIDGNQYLGSVDEPYLALIRAGVGVYNSIAETTVAIASDAFWGRIELNTLDLNSRVSSLYGGLFNDCGSLTDILLPPNLSYMDAQLFDNCGMLNYNTDDKCDYLSSYYDRPYMYLIRCTDPDLTEYKLPEDTVMVCGEAFYEHTRLSEIDLSSVKVIEDRAFMQCSALTAADIPASVERVGAESFKNCGALREINIAEGVELIGEGCFERCGLTEVTIPSGVHSLGTAAFKDCKNLQSVELPLWLPRIEEFTFEGCVALGSVKMPEQVRSIGNRAFYNCSMLNELSFSDLTVHIGDYAFANCTLLKELLLPNNEISLGEGAFSDCKGLENVILPDKLTVISKNLFSGCEKLHTVIIPDAVREIGEEAFKECSLLQEVSIPDGLIHIDKNSFFFCNKLKYNIYEGGKYLGNNLNPYVVFMERDDNLDSVYDYMINGVNWKVFDCTVNENTKVINSSAFFGSSVRIVNLPKGLVTIEYAAFCECKLLEKINLPEGLIYIGDYAFGGCKNLSEITVPASVKILGSGVFNDCGLTKMTLQNGLESIGESCFEGCEKLNSVILPDTLTVLSDCAFKNCYYVNNVTIPGGVRKIGNEAFSKCIRLENITIGNGVREIGDRAFYCCDRNLIGITLPDSIERIGDKAFYYCLMLSGVTIPYNVRYIGDQSFGDCANLQTAKFENNRLWYAKVGENTFAVSETELMKNEVAVEYLKQGGLFNLLK